jgi:hypothetical protein
MTRGWLTVALGLCACLPDDTRPPPGRLDVTVSPDEVLAPNAVGMDTADGWRVTFDRFVITLGSVKLDGDDCSVYNEFDYLRVMSPGATSTQKVSTPYARGACEVGFQMRPPTSDAALGTGVTEADLLLVGAPASDTYAADAGAALFVSGRAVSGASEKRFAWAFRRGYQYDACELQGEPGVVLASNEERVIDIVVRSSTLFASRPDDDSAELRFGPFAEADDAFGDADGEVKLEELAAAPFDLANQHPEWKTLADYLYLALVPRVPRYRATGTCTIGPYVEEHDGP